MLVWGELLIIWMHTWQTNEFILKDTTMNFSIVSDHNFSIPTSNMEIKLHLKNTLSSFLCAWCCIVFAYIVYMGIIWKIPKNVWFILRVHCRPIYGHVWTRSILSNYFLLRQNASKNIFGPSMCRKRSRNLDQYKKIEPRQPAPDKFIAFSWCLLSLRHTAS